MIAVGKIISARRVNGPWIRLVVEVGPNLLELNTLPSHLFAAVGLRAQGCPSHRQVRRLAKRLIGLPVQINPFNHLRMLLSDTPVLFTPADRPTSRWLERFRPLMTFPTDLQQIPSRFASTTTLP